MKVVSLAVLVLATAAPHASFDMMLIANAGDGRIHRYDPENAVSLGSFAVTGTMIDIVANQSANEVYVLARATNGSTAIIRHDYNTGAYKGVVPLAGTFGIPKKVTLTGTGELLVSYERDVVRYNPATGAQIGNSLFYSDRKFIFNGGATFLANGLYTLAGDSDGTVWSQDYLMTFAANNTQTDSLGSPTGQAEHSYRDIVANANGSAAIVSSVINANNVSFVKYNTTVFGMTATTISAGLGGTGLTANGAEWGHAGRAYLIVHQSGAGTLTCLPFDTQLGLIGASQVIPGFTSASNFYRGSAMIVAPEPGSLVAFSLGALALLRRKRAK